MLRVLRSVAGLCGRLGAIGARWLWYRLRGRARFRATLRRMGLPPDAVRALGDAYDAGTALPLTLWRRGPATGDAASRGRGRGHASFPSAAHP